MSFAEISDKRMVESVQDALGRVEFYYEPTGLKRRMGDGEFTELTQQMSAPCSMRPWMNWEETNDNAPTEDDLTDYIVDRLGVNVFRSFATEAGRDVKPLLAWGWEMLQLGEGATYQPQPDSVGYIDLRVGGLCALLDTKLIGEVLGEQVEGKVEAEKLSTYLLVVSDRVQMNLGLDNSFKHSRNKNPHQVMRYNFKREDTYPTPGEFLGLAVKFMIPHVVKQLSNPVLFTGHYMETKSYTSGIVENYITSGGDRFYDVKVKHGTFFTIKSTDFFTYEVGERVAIVKVLQPNNYKSSNLLYDGSDIFRIAPITFYE